MSLYMLTLYIFTSTGQIVRMEQLHTFKDGSECVSYISDVQNQTTARLTDKLRAAVAKGDLHIRAICTQGA